MVSRKIATSRTIELPILLRNADFRIAMIFDFLRNYSKFLFHAELAEIFEESRSCTLFQEDQFPFPALKKY